MFLCLKRRLKRRNAWFWRFKQRFKHRKRPYGFGVFDIYGSPGVLSGARYSSVYDDRKGKYRAENVSAAALRALGSLQRGADADFYAYALSLFFDRARAFERATGTRLLCDDDDAHARGS